MRYRIYSEIALGAFKEHPAAHPVPLHSQVSPEGQQALQAGAGVRVEGLGFVEFRVQGVGG